MRTLDLSFRQRKLLYLLLAETAYTTSGKLAEILKVSSRTIRNDIAEINQALSPYNARVLMTNGKGILFQAADINQIRTLCRNNVSFFMTRQDRVRHLAYSLCLNDGPLDLDGLEEEMFVSRSALMKDIQALRQEVVTDEPYIRLTLAHGAVSFEQDELKIRSVLLKLFHRDWDYDAAGNAFFAYDFLDEALMQVLARSTSSILNRFGLRMDDPSLVALELSLAIMHHRNQIGHPFPDGLPMPAADTPEGGATEALMRFVEEQTRRTYPDSEKARLYQFISESCIPGSARYIEGDRSVDFAPGTLRVASVYFSELREVFGIDFSKDEELSRVLIFFFHNILIGNGFFFRHQDMNALKNHLIVEYELAYLFQILAPGYLGRPLYETELANLALCLSGALRKYIASHPKKKLKTVLFSHRNLIVAWEMKCRLLDAYGAYLEIQELLPVNFKDIFDFTQVDLIFSTVKKTISELPGLETLQVSDAPDADLSRFAYKIRTQSLKEIWPTPRDSLERAFAEAFWYENAAMKDKYQVIQTMTADYIREGIASEIHKNSILDREKQSSFASRSGIVFLHTLFPAKKTRLAVMSLKHPIDWNEFRISTVVMLIHCEDDRNLLFHLKLHLYRGGFDAKKLEQRRSRQELLPYLLAGEP